MGSEDRSSSFSNSLQSISGGASWFLFGRIIRQGLMFLLNFALTNTLGATLYGLYALGSRILNISTTFAHLGANQSVLKYAPEYSSSRRDRIFGMSILSATAGSLFLSLLLLLFAPIINNATLESDLFVDVLRIFSIILFLQVIIDLSNNIYRSTNSMKYVVLVNDITFPGLKIAIVLIAIYLGHSIVGVSLALLLAGIISVGLSIYILVYKVGVSPDFKVRKGEVKEFLNFSLPLTVSDVGWVLNTQIDVLMVGYFLSSSSVGIYNIAVLVSGLMLLPLSAVNQLFPPIASQLYSEKKYNDLESIFRTVTRWVLTITLPIAAFLIIHRREILQIFGSEFSEGMTVFSIFIVAQTLNGAVGPSGYLLMITEHQYLKSINHWGFAFVNIILNIILIQKFGIFGAAIATTISIVGLNICRLLEIWFLEGLAPYSVNLWKPLVATTITIIPIYALSAQVDGLGWAAIAGLFGSILYFVLLYMLGLEKEDRELVRSII